LDATYKTNRFRLPLLHVVGIDCFYKTFSSCFAFIQSETQQDFSWTIECFKKLFGRVELPSLFMTDCDTALMDAISLNFPGSTNLLCVWHIEKNILAKGKKHFEFAEEWKSFIRDWNSLINTPQIDQIDDSLNSFYDQYAQKNQLISYIQRTWIIPHKKKFFSVWRDSFKHFGTATSSRVESAHAEIKSYIQNSSGDLFMAWTKIHAALEKQIRTFNDRLAEAFVRFPHSVLNIPILMALRGKISLHAIDIVNKVYTDAWNIYTNGISYGIKKDRLARL
jgi:hypothetical protein